MESSRISIEKLNGNNYISWAAQMEASLVAKELWEFVDGSAEAENNFEQMTVEPKKHFNETRALLICNFHSSIVPLIMMKKNPRDIWDTLATIHKSKCTASKYTLRTKLLNLKMTSHQTVRQFASSICVIETKLLYAGHNTDEEDKKYVLLNGLRKEFMMKKEILQEKDSSFEEMVSALELAEAELSSKIQTQNSEGRLLHGNAFISHDSVGMSRNEHFYFYKCKRKY